MSEYRKEKLYWLKLPKDFFDQHWVKVLEGMPNGPQYLLMYLKLMCESISHNGYLRYSEEIPYTPEMIASVTGTNVDVVRSGLKALSALGLITETEGGSLYIPEVPALTSSRTLGAELKSRYRAERDGRQMSAECPPRDIENRDIENRLIKQDITRYNPASLALLTQYGYITEEEAGDPQWSELLGPYEAEHGVRHAKVRLRHILNSVSSLIRDGETKDGKPRFRRAVTDPPANRYGWLAKALRDGYDERKESEDEKV